MKWSRLLALPALLSPGATDGQTLTYAAAPGEANRLTVTHDRRKGTTVCSMETANAVD